MTAFGWVERQLGEICRFQAGSAFPQKHQGLMYGDFPFIKVSDMNLPGNEVQITVSNNWVTDDLRKNLRGKPLPPGTPVFAKIGEALKHNRIRLLSRPTIVDNNMMGAIPNEAEVHGRFLYYLLKQIGLPRLATGTSVPYLTVSVLSRVPVDIPPFPTQRRIASILSAYDDLIENNTRRIAILEEMARRLYEEWFVHFRFPGHEVVKMVESEIGEVPEGWGVCCLGKVLSTLESGSRPKGGIDSSETEVPSIGAENINGLGNYDYTKEKFISLDYFQNMRRGQIKSGDVLLYKDGAHIGRKALFRDGYPHETCAVNEHVFILRPACGLTPTWLYFWLDRPELTHEIRNLNANAAQPGINQKGVRGLPIMLPPQALIEKFEAAAEPLLRLLFNLAKRIQILRGQRDLLLPKLVSGEIDVSELEEPPEEAAAE